LETVYYQTDEELIGTELPIEEDIYDDTVHVAQVKDLNIPVLHKIKIQKVKQPKAYTTQIEEVKLHTVKSTEVKNKAKKSKFFKALLLTPGQLAYCNKQSQGDKQTFDKLVTKIYRTLYYKKVTELKESWFKKSKITNLDLAHANNTLKNMKNEDIDVFGANLNIWFERVVPKVENDIRNLTPNFLSQAQPSTSRTNTKTPIRKNTAVKSENKNKN